MKGERQDAALGETRSEYEQHAVTSRPRRLVVHMTHACNLACPYCFNSLRSAEGVTPCDVREAVDTFLDPEADLIQLSFIGGEPLLKWRQIKESIRLVALGRARFPVVALTTNGTPLTAEMIRELTAIKARVMVSIEGTFDRQMRLRPPMTERRYARLTDHVQCLVESLGTNVAARMTLWGETENFVNEVAAVVALGVRRILIYPDAGMDPAACEAVMMDLSGAFADDVVQGRLVLEPLSSRYYQPAGGWKRTICGAGRDFLVLAPDRRIYPCHRHVGSDAFAIGELDAGLNGRRLQRWLDGMDAMSQSCDSCAAAPSCRFPCAYPRFPGAGRSGEAWCGWMRAAARAAQAAHPTASGRSE